MKHKNLRVVITGASSGIGAATAIAFARQGAHLLLGARGKAGLEDIAWRCREAGGMADTKIVDATDAAAVARFADHARDVLGGIDLWFSAVGIGVVGKYHDVPLEDHRRVIETNLLSHMHDAHAVLPLFRRQGHGTWINMISAGGFIASPYAAAYSASKFGLRGFSEALRGELRDQPRIHVCDVYPTFVDTPGFEHAGNYTGARLSYPPGVLDPETVAEAIVKLAARPRATTVIGAPASMLKLGELAAPATTSLMGRFLDTWSRRADRTADTTGSMYTPPRSADGVHSHGLRPQSQGHAKLALGAALVAAVVGVQLARRRP